MYNMVCYRYLSYYPPDEDIAYQASNSIELDRLYELLDRTNNYFIDNNMDIDDTTDIVNMLEVIKRFSKEAIESYNSRWTQGSYLWIDEILPIRMTGYNAKILSVNNSFNGNSEEMNRIISTCIDLLRGRGIYTGELFNDLIFLIFIDIIPKDQPTFVVFPPGFNEDEFFGDNDYDDED